MVVLSRAPKDFRVRGGPRGPNGAGRARSFGLLRFKQLGARSSRRSAAPVRLGALGGLNNHLLLNPGSLGDLQFDARHLGDNRIGVQQADPRHQDGDPLLEAFDPRLTNKSVNFAQHSSSRRSGCDASRSSLVRVGTEAHRNQEVLLGSDAYLFESVRLFMV